MAIAPSEPVYVTETKQHPWERDIDPCSGQPPPNGVHGSNLPHKFHSPGYVFQARPNLLQKCFESTRHKSSSELTDMRPEPKAADITLQRKPRGVD